MLVHLPREAGWGVIPPTKNGPALAGYGRSRQHRGEVDVLFAHARFAVETGVPVFFAEPHSPAAARQR